MKETPYRNLPDYCFWRKAHAVEDLIEIDPVVSSKFKIDRSHKLATAGSCFAQHVARHLKKSGFNYFVAETAHPLIARVEAQYNYELFSGRYGNIYTVAQLRQLMDRAYGRFKPLDDIWEGEDGNFYDPFRPTIQPDGFASREEYYADRAQHFAAFRRIVEELNVFVFTFGLTEAWRAKLDGAVYPLCPGVAAGTYDENLHEFVNYDVRQVVEDMGYFISEARKLNRGLKFILTVSPVPLVATAVNRSVIQSTIYSKSVLRVAAETLSSKRPNVAYFPSYEIITGPGARGRYFAEDCREVLPAGVEHVMRLFMKHYTASVGAEARKHEPAEEQHFDIESFERKVKIICDEEILAASRE